MHVVVTEFMDETALERFGPEIRLTYGAGPARVAASATHSRVSPMAMADFHRASQDR